MLADVKSRYAVDEERVFATGHSWGSMMTQYLGMALPELFTAIAPAPACCLTSTTGPC